MSDLFAVPDGAHDPFQVVAVRSAYQSPWIEVEHRDVVRPDGQPGIYGLVRFANLAVGVLPLFDDGTVAMVGQWRVPLDRWSWEIPEGGVPHAEAALDGAARELAEEVGVQAAHWLEILQLDLSNSVTDERAVLYLAWGLEPASPVEGDPTEVLVQRRVAFGALLDAVGRGEVRDSLTVAAALRVHHLAITGQLAGRLPDHVTRAILQR